MGPALAKDAERYLIGALAAGGTASATAAVDTSAKAKAAARKLASEMDEAEVPGDGRYLLVNPAGKALIVELLGDSNATQASGDELRRNEVGPFAGFTVIWSANFPAEITGAAFVAYHSAAAAFAPQVTGSRAVPAQDGHADIVSTIAVYGAKVTRPAAVRTAGFNPSVLAPEPEGE